MTTDTKKYWTTSVSDIEEASVFIRGYDLGTLIGNLSFAGATFLLIRGRLPSPGESKVMDAILCCVLDYALKKPGTAAARYCVSGNPSMVAGLATAVLAAGEYTLAPDAAGFFLAKTYQDFKQSDEPMAVAADRIVSAMRSCGERVPGFGHPNFRYVDPRAQTLKNIAVTNGVWGEMCDWYEAIHVAFTTQAKKPELAINDVGMMAAILTQMGFTPQEMTGIAVLSTLPGVVAHISEELQSKTRIRVIPDSNVEYNRLRRDLLGDLSKLNAQESKH